MGVIIFNGVSSEDVGIFVETIPDYSYAGKNFNMQEIEGAHGSMIIGKATYGNTTKAYNIAFKVSTNDTFDAAAARVVAWLNSSDGGYARLEDSYEPTVYRKAVYVEEGSIGTQLRKVGRAPISFQCMPQRFLKSGEELINISSSGTIVTNPTNKIAKPMFTIYGSGSGVLEVNDYQISISEITDSMLIDCELENAFSGASNLNNVISVGPNWFPVLEPGDNNIVFSNGIASVSVLPRWWTI